MSVKEIKKPAASKKKVVPAKKAAAKKVVKLAITAKPVAVEKKEIAIVSSPFWNIWDAGRQYKVRLCIPGLTKKNIKVDVDGNNLTIGSEKEVKSEKVKKNYLVKQYSFNSWSKTIALPEKVNEENVKINYKDGVLKIGLNKF